MQKNVLTIIFTAILLLFITNKGETAVRSTHASSIVQHSNIGKINDANLSKEIIVKQSFKQKCTNFFIKSFKVEESKPSKPSGGGKNQIVAFLLCLFLGFLGIHRFYLGYTGMGVLYILTLGLGGIGWLIDLILLIIPNGLTPKGKPNYRN